MSLPRSPWMLLACLAVAGCAGDPAAAPDTGSPIAWCEGSTGYLYEPDTLLTTFPDDWWTVPDDSTATGLRVSMSPDDPALSETPDAYLPLFDQLSTLDGFGLTAALAFRFSAAIETPTEGDLVLLAQTAEGWEEHATTTQLIDGGRTLMVVPWMPLPPGSRAILALRTDPAADDCVSPSPDLRALLEPTATGRLAEQYAEGLDALGWSPDQVGAMVVFTTQSAEDVDAAVIADIDGQQLGLDAPMSCADSETWRRCDGTITVGDYRGEDGIVPAGPVQVRSTYALPLVLWLPPADQPGPYPVVLCGHGLGGSTSQCDFLADLAGPLGVAVAAVDAQCHGAHPTADPSATDLDRIMALFGFTLVPPSLDALVMRDNFRASAWDKLQVVRAIELGLDVDGDGTTELDATRMGYAGASLGGIMGPELMAGAPGLGPSVLIVPGGGLLNIVLDSDTFGIIAKAMTPGDWDQEDLMRSIPLVQTLVDAGDPLTFAAQLTRRRAAQPGPDLALMMAVDDSIVPNSSTIALTQALAVDGIGTEFVAVPGVSFGPGPASGNLVDGATGALVQLDQTQPARDAEWEQADHSTVHESIQAEDLLVPFFLDAFAGKTPIVSDPYAD